MQWGGCLGCLWKAAAVSGSASPVSHWWGRAAGLWLQDEAGFRCSSCQQEPQLPGSPGAARRHSRYRTGSGESFFVERGGPRAAPSRGSVCLGSLASDCTMSSPGLLWPQSRSFLLRASIAALLVCAISHIPAAAAQPKPLPRSGGETKAPELLSRAARTAREMLEYLLGEETLRSVSEGLSNLVWILCTGISTGLITVSGLLGQLLDVVGLDGKQISGILALSPAQVQHVLLWAMLALLGYWMLSLVLGLVLSLLAQLLWGLKISLFLVAFFYMVTGIQDPNLLATSLLGLVGVYALLGWIGSGGRGSGHLEAKVRSLEKQVEDLRMRPRRVVKKDEY